MSQLVKVSTQELGIPFGKDLHIELLSTKERHTVSVVGYLPNNTLITTAPVSNGKKVPLPDASNITARFMMGTRVCAFVSKVNKAPPDNIAYYHIPYPTEIDSSVIRDKVRMETSLISIAKPIDHSKSIEAVDSGILIDLSLGGAKLVSKNDFGYENHFFNLAFKVDVADFNQIINLTCEIKLQEIKSTKEIKSQIKDVTDIDNLGADYLYVYNLKFDKLTKSQLILLTAFILENGATL